MSDYWNTVPFTCFTCDKKLSFDSRKIITVRIVGSLERVGVCGLFETEHPNEELWERVEEIEHVFFLKRLSNPYYSFADYWYDRYKEKDELVI